MVEGEEAEIIGEVRGEPARMVLMPTRFGGARMKDMLVCDRCRGPVRRWFR